MTFSNRVRGVEDREISVSSKVWDVLTGCIGTFLWLVVLAWTGYLGWPVAIPLSLLLVGVFTAWWSSARVSRVVRWLLPVVGDVDRCRRRGARRRGNAWLRESGLVCVDDHTSYRVWLWPDRLVIESLPVVGVAEETVRKAVVASLSAWNMADYELVETGNNSWSVSLFAESRLSVLMEPRVSSGVPDVEAGSGFLRVRVGRGFDGDAWIDLAETSGVLVAGLPGSGKSQGMLVLVSALMSRRDLVDVYVVDGKGGGDWGWLAPYCVDYVDGGIDEVLDVLGRVRELMTQRLRRNKELGRPDFWHDFGLKDRFDHAVVVVLDEVQAWTSPASPDRASRAKASEFVSLAADIVRRGRAAGVCLVMGTQKATADTIPTGLRDLCGLRVAFRCSTPEMARAALGVLPEGSANPLDVPRSAPGLAVVAGDDDTASFVRFDLVDRDVVSDALYELRWYDVWAYDERIGESDGDKDGGRGSAAS